MAKKGSLQHIRIEPADNGYTVHAHHREPIGDGKGTMPMMDHNEKPHLALTKEDASAHVGKLLAEHEGTSSGPSDNDADDKKKHPAYGAFGRGR